MITLSRGEVYAAIDKERDYQDSKWGVEQPQSFMGLIAVIEAELNEVKLGWLKNLPGKSAPLNELVQVAATAVAALEKYGIEGCPGSTDDIPPSWFKEYTIE